MSQFRLQNYIFVPEFQFKISRQKPKYSIRRYEESFENNSIKHVCTVKKIFKNSQTDAILPKSRVRQKCNRRAKFKKNQKRARHKEKNFPLNNDTSCISISPSAEEESISSYFKLVTHNELQRKSTQKLPTFHVQDK